MFHLSYLDNTIQFFFAFISRICRTNIRYAYLQIRGKRSCKMDFLTIFMQRPYSEPPGAHPVSSCGTPIQSGKASVNHSEKNRGAFYELERVLIYLEIVLFNKSVLLNVM